MPRYFLGTVLFKERVSIQYDLRNKRTAENVLGGGLDVLKQKLTALVRPWGFMFRPDGKPTRRVGASVQT